MATAADILGGYRQVKIVARWSHHYNHFCAERDRLEARDCRAPETCRTKWDDLTEGASDESEASISLVATSATQHSIFEVQAAIGRIERGTYGICELTGDPIEAERLKAIPWARYSLRGQSELEKAGEVRKHAVPRLEALNEVTLAEGEEAATQETE